MKTYLLSGAALAACISIPAYAQGVAAEVVITASPLAHGSIELSQSVAQITPQELATSGGFGLGDALRSVPGVTSSGFAPGAARPVIRGFDAARVRVTENGLGSADVSDISADHAVPVDPLSAVEVEVLRGPGTLRYGSQAIGGVVNAINNRIPLDIAEGRTIEAFTSLGTSGTERMAGGIADYRDGALAFHADGLIRATDDYDTPDGDQMNSYTLGRGFALGGAYLSGMSGGGLSFGRYDARYGVPTEPGGEVAHIELEQNRYRGALRFDQPFAGLARINAEGGYSDYTHDEVVDGEGVLATFNNDEWEGRAELVHDGFGPIRTGAFGVQAGRRDFEGLGEAADYLLPTQTDTIAAYLFEDIGVTGTFHIEAAGRIEDVQVDGETVAFGPLARGFTPASVALGAVFQPVPSFSLALNLSSTARAPNAAELFAQGPHEATGTFEIGDPTLGEERARSAEMSARYEGENGARASLSLFHTEFDGFITGLLTGNSYDEDGNIFADDSGEFAELLYVQDDATFRGIEAQAHIPVWETWGGSFGIDLQADYVRASFDAGGNVPRIPPRRYGGGLFFERPGLEMRLSALRVDSQKKIAAGETPTGGYVMVDASLIARVYDGDAGALDLSLIGSNLADERARNHVSFTKDHVLLPGRAGRLLLRWVY